MGKKIILLVMMAFVVAAFAACATKQEPKKENNQAVEETQQPKNEAKDINIAKVITDEWQKSGHATAVGADDPTTSPAMREGCASCHNGYAYETKSETLDKIALLKGQSCDTCHTMHGKEIMDSGTVETALGNIKGGSGTICSSCHFGRGKKPDQSSAPHHSVQTDMLLSKSGAEVEGYDYGTSPHANNPNSCLSCHMAEDKNGIRDHGFAVSKENIANSCGKCHSGLDTINRKAPADYDGNGKTEGIQDEVAGLLDILDKAILDKLNGGKYASVHGKIEFQDTQGNPVEAPPSPELYDAAWNHMFVSNDGSKGVHNPVYSVQLLQQSYKKITGNDVPNAKML